MKESTITKKVVFDTCKSILDKGGDVSCRRVLNEIGSGSMTGIATYVRLWKSEQRESTKGKAAASEAFFSAFNAEVERLVTDAVKQHVDEIEDLKTENDEVLKHAAELESQIEMLQNREQTHKDELEKLRHQLTEKDATEVESSAQKDILKQQLEAKNSEVIARSIEVATLTAELAASNKEGIGKDARIQILEDRVKAVEAEKMGLLERALEAEAREKVLILTMQPEGGAEDKKNRKRGCIAPDTSKMSREEWKAYAASRKNNLGGFAT